MKRIAIILTSHNRVSKTYNCIDKLINSNLPINHIIEIFLVDDLSKDNTQTVIKKSFPQVEVIEGDGNLYWCGGMRRAWTQAFNKYDFDYYIWINDDVEIFNNSIIQLLEVQNEYFLNNAKNCIVFGFCSSFNDNDITYGGIYKKRFLKPNGKLQKAELINGNFVLVPKQVFEILGNLSEKYTHGMADYDYSLRANENNVECISTKVVVAKCNRNVDIYTSNCISFKQKLRYLLNVITNKNSKFKFNEYIYFRNRFFNEKKYFIYIKYTLFFFIKIVISTIRK